MMIEQEYDGMLCDEYSEPYEYDNGYKGEQPYIQNFCDYYFGYCLGVCDGSCIW